MILPLDQLAEWRRRMESPAVEIVATNGCFDLLTRAHCGYLNAASWFGYQLVVGINSDESVRQLKGPTRPINPALDRAYVVDCLTCVSVVTIFPQTRATEFLRITRPKIWVKGGDYTLDTIDPGERAVLEEMGTEIKFIPLIESPSTTTLIERIGLHRVEHQPTH